MWILWTVMLFLFLKKKSYNKVCAINEKSMHDMVWKMYPVNQMSSLCITYVRKCETDITNY